ncbi:unnamed protein product [marine sediment metagenome]|uniref:Uncharacterized protein n=1 Tax=marine sediment metagenome TaxID=412755 RepID=X0UUX7_9ZZZZ
MKCICGKELTGKQQSCSDKCKKRRLRSGTNGTLTGTNEQPGQQVGQPVTFQGRTFKGDELEQSVTIGSMTHKIKDLPTWMKEGELESDKLPHAGKQLPNGRYIDPQEKRAIMKDLMLQYDTRYGARDSNYDLIAMKYV